jgi:hypothetical protein
LIGGDAKVCQRCYLTWTGVYCFIRWNISILKKSVSDFLLTKVVKQNNFKILGHISLFQHSEQGINHSILLHSIALGTGKLNVEDLKFFLLLLWFFPETHQIFVNNKCVDGRICILYKVFKYFHFCYFRATDSLEAEFKLEYVHETDNEWSLRMSIENEDASGNMLKPVRVSHL